jgi:hypothetical protein
MKHILFLVAASALIFASCNDNTPETPGSENPDNGIPLTDVDFVKPALTLMVGENATLEVVFTPADATNKNITWENLNKDIVTLGENGAVTAIAAGEAKITVTAEEGGHTATCTITVNPLPALTIAAEGTKEITDGAFTFESTGGELILNVTTNQPEWSYTLDPSEGWLTAAKADNTLTLTAAGNYLPTTVDDITLTFTAGDAESVTLTLSQTMGAPEMVYVEGGTSRWAALLRQARRRSNCPFARSL